MAKDDKVASGGSAPAVAPVAEPTLEQLRSQVEKMRGDAKVSTGDLIKAALTLQKAEAAEERAKADAERSAAKAKYDAAMAAITGPVGEIVNDVHARIKAVRQALVAAGVTGLSITITAMDQADMLTSVKPSGPGVPSSAPRAPRATNGNGGGGKVFYRESATGRELARLEFVAELTGDAAPNPNGLGPKARRLAEKHGWVEFTK